MSGLCNYCEHQRILASAKEQGSAVTALRGWWNGKDVFVHPPDITIEAGAAEEDHPQFQYWRCWFMGLPGHCCC